MQTTADPQRNLRHRFQSAALAADLSALRRCWREAGCLKLTAAYAPAALEALGSALEPGRPASGAGGRSPGQRRLLEQSEAVRGLARGETALGLARLLLGPDARPVKAVLFDKTAEANWTLPWHQDLTVALAQRREVPGFTRWSLKAGVPHAEAPLETLQGMLALRLHLDPCDALNGPLLVVEGSHRLGKLSQDQRDSLPRQQPVTACEAQAGDLLVMHPLILHRSAPARRPRRRRVLHIEYAATDLPGGLAWHAEGPDRGTETDG